MYRSIATLLIFALLIGCDSATDTPDTVELDYAPVLQNVGPNVIVATYRDLDTAAEELLSRINTLVQDPTDDHLKASQSAWVSTRAPWEASEGFLFGPVDKFGLDPALDTWPVDEIIIGSILNGDDSITPEFVANQDVDSGLKGFHVIEFLLYGENGDKAASDFVMREMDYLLAATKVLRDDAKKLHDSWRNGGDNFVVNVTGAGSQGSQFVSMKDATLTLIDATVGIADEVGAGKMQVPLDEGLVQVESRFSGNSKNDFQNNMRSIQHIYMGDYGSHNGPGLTDIVLLLDPNLDQQIRSGITAAISSIGNITGEFRDAITANPTDIKTAIRTVLDLKADLEKASAIIEDAP